MAVCHRAGAGAAGALAADRHQSVLGAVPNALAHGPAGAVVEQVAIVLDGADAQERVEELPYPFAIKR
jgi:hypothetical protein